MLGLWTADSARPSPPPIHPSPVPPQLCQEPRNGWNGPKAEDKSQTEELLRTLRKCFIIFKKDCQGFSQGTHDPCFISSLFSISFRFFFQPETTLKSWVKPHACVPVCVLVWTDGCCFHKPVFLFWSHSGATEGRWRVILDTVAKQLYLSIWRSLSEDRRLLRKRTCFPLLGSESALRVNKNAIISSDGTIFVYTYVLGVLENDGVHMIQARSQPEYKVNTTDWGLSMYALSGPAQNLATVSHAP